MGFMLSLGEDAMAWMPSSCVRTFCGGSGQPPLIRTLESELERSAAILSACATRSSCDYKNFRNAVYGFDGSASAFAAASASSAFRRIAIAACASCSSRKKSGRSPPSAACSLDLQALTGQSANDAVVLLQPHQRAVEHVVGALDGELQGRIVSIEDQADRPGRLCACGALVLDPVGVVPRRPPER